MRPHKNSWIPGRLSLRLICPEWHLTSVAIFFDTGRSEQQPYGNSAKSRP